MIRFSMNGSCSRARGQIRTVGIRPFDDIQRFWHCAPMEIQSSVPFGGHAPEGFAVEAFSVLGDHEGSGWWEYGQLSKKWIANCRQVIDHYGPEFDHQWAQELGQFRTRLTFTRGVGILTIYADNRGAASILILSGDDQNAEVAVTQLFIDSLLSSIPNEVLEGGQRFSGVASLPRRPAMAVVTFPDPERSDVDDDLVRELGWHFAAAILLWWGGQRIQAGD